MSAPADLAAYRAARDEPEPEPDELQHEGHPIYPSLEHRANGADESVFGEIADRIIRIEQRLAKLERRARL